MKSSTWFLVIALFSAGANAATIDMNDARRAVGSEDDIRVDAQLTDDVVSPHSALGVTVQIHNLSPRTIAIDDKVCEASYDSDSRTITLSVGSEVPKGGEMPRLATIRSGEKRIFRIGTVLGLNLQSLRMPRAPVPSFVQIKVNVLRDVAPFVALMDRQSQSQAGVAIALNDDQFDQWLKTNQSIFLNVLPVHYRPADETRTGDASRR